MAGSESEGGVHHDQTGPRADQRSQPLSAATTPRVLRGLERPRGHAGCAGVGAGYGGNMECGPWGVGVGLGQTQAEQQPQDQGLLRTPPPE